MTERSELESTVRGLEGAWNAMDGEAFAAPFARDADFVNIVGEHMRGREAIARGHAAIFRDFYAGSKTRLTVESVRFLRPDVALVHVESELDAPTGPLAGRHIARFSFVATTSAELGRSRRSTTVSNGGGDRRPASAITLGDNNVTRYYMR